MKNNICICIIVLFFLVSCWEKNETNETKDISSENVLDSKSASNESLNLKLSWVERGILEEYSEAKKSNNTQRITELDREIKAIEEDIRKKYIESLKWGDKEYSNELREELRSIKRMKQKERD